MDYTRHGVCLVDMVTTAVRGATAMAAAMFCKACAIISSSVLRSRAPQWRIYMLYMIFGVAKNHALTMLSLMASSV